MVVAPQGLLPLRLAMFGLVVLLILNFFRRVAYHLRRAKGLGWTPAG
jgi:hypothetical protein